LYLSKFEESRISNAMDSEKMANLSVIQPAYPPSKPVAPRKRLNMLIALLLGGFGGLGLAFFMEYLDESLENPDDVEKHLQLPVLASIPKLSG
jgi:capsular polysaccharide biosynthesis protein